MSGTYLKFLCILVIIDMDLISAEDHSHFNTEIFLKNERLLTKFVDCILDDGPCFGPIAKIKEEMPRMMETKCAQCQKQVKDLGIAVMSYIRDHKPDKWERMQEMYDPDHKYQQELEELLDDDY